MREILTIVAGLLALVLTVAFVGPYVIDWNAHREWVEAQLSEATGANVAVEGPISITLLPTPRLAIERVKISGSAPGLPSLTADAMRLELSATPLMRGELRFTDASIDAPVLRAAIGSDGGVALPSLTGAPPDRIVIDRLKITDGAIEIDDPSRGRRLSVAAIEFEGEASSLVGPFRGAGSFGREATAFRFTTGALEQARMRLKLIVDETPRTPKLDLDGAFQLADAPGGASKLTYGGPATLSGTFRSVAWRATGALTADPAAAIIDNLEIRAGAEDKAFNATGKARLDFTAMPAGAVELQARQIDIDRLFGGDAQAASRFADSLAGFVDGPQWTPPAPLSIRLASPAMTLAGETLGDVSMGLTLASGATPAIRFDANGPGRSHLELDGSVETGLAAKFSGRVDASVRDMARFDDWLDAVSPGLASRLRNLPMRSLEVAGAVDVSRAGFSGRDLTLKADRSNFKGALAFTRAVGTEAARLFADLTSPALDLDGVPDLSGAATAATGLDLSLSLTARAVRLARFGEGVIDAGRIGMRLSKTGDDIRLENFTIANLGGAALNANGSLGAGGAQLDARLDATRLVELADLVKKVAPGATADAFASRAVSLSPARFNLKLAAAGLHDLRGSTLTLDATARGTTLKGSIRPNAGDPSNLQASLTLDSPDASMLLRQIGVDALPLTSAGRGALNLSASGDPTKGMDAKLDATIAGTSISYVGAIGQALGPSGDLRLRSANLAPLLQIVGIASPDPFGPSLPVELDGKVSRGDQRWTLAGLAGRIGPSRLSGDLALERGDDASKAFRASGMLRFDRLTLGNLAALVYGAPGGVRPGAVWSEARFAPGLSSPPETTVDLAVERFDLSGDFAASDARMQLGVAPGVVTLSGATMRIAGGTLGGSVVLRRDGQTAAASGQIDAQDLAVERPWLAGRFAGKIEFTSTGASQQALIAGLAGGGSVAARDIRIPGADPDAVHRVVGLAEKDAIPAAEPDVRSALGLELPKAPLTLGARSFDATLASGVLRLTPSAGGPELALSVDLKSLSVDQRATLADPSPPKDWNEAAPQASIVWRGPLANPARAIDAASLGNALSIRAIARETARMQAFEADVRERAAFNRRVKALQFMRQRAQEIAAYEAEQARIAVEEERRRAAEAARLEREQKARDAAEAVRLDREQRAEADRLDRERRAAEAAQRAREHTPIVPPPAMTIPGAIDPSASGRY